MTSYPLTAVVTDSVTGAAGTLSAPFTVAPAVVPPASSLMLGIYDVANDWPSSWSGEQVFTNAGCAANVAAYYVQWNGGFPTTLAASCLANGATLFVEMEPWYTSTTWPVFSTIAAGGSDAYLRSMAAAVNTFGHPVMFTFAHEQNGNWYPWGNGGPQGVTPAQWVAAWQHVVSVMNSVTSLITWVWAPNNADVGSVVPYWPGQQFVGLAAFDGYLQNASQTYSNFLKQTVTQIRTLTSGPIWNSETGIGPAGVGRAARITQYVADMKAGGISGFMWWNQSPFNLTAPEIAALSAAVQLWNRS
jgi:mannan endo-1,4-beta-mannosidase